MRAERVRTPAILAAAMVVAVVVAILLAAPTVMVPAKASRGDVPSIAFTSDRKATAESSFNIYRIDADGHGPAKRLTDIPGSNVMPAWAPDGSEIAFVNSGLTGIPDIYRMDADGSNESSLTSGLLFELEPTWYPGGRRIVYSDADDLFSMTLDAGGTPTGVPTRLTKNAGVDRQPTVSPNGKRIAFSSDRDGDYDIYVMKAAPESSTNQPVKLTRNTRPDTLPDWSPAGGMLAFSTGNEGTRDIYTIKADFQNISPAVNLVGDAADDSDPAWSPDGRKVAFISDRSGDSEIWVVGADGTDPSNITKNPASEELQPDWQPLQ